MIIAVLGILAWLLILVTGITFARAAKRGDELPAASRFYTPNPAGDAQIIPFRPAVAARRISHTGPESTTIICPPQKLGIK